MFWFKRDTSKIRDEIVEKIILRVIDNELTVDAGRILLLNELKKVKCSKIERKDSVWYYQHLVDHNGLHKRKWNEVFNK